LCHETWARAKGLGTIGGIALVPAVVLVLFGLPSLHASYDLPKIVLASRGDDDQGPTSKRDPGPQKPSITEPGREETAGDASRGIGETGQGRDGASGAGTQDQNPQGGEGAGGQQTSGQGERGAQRSAHANSGGGVGSHGDTPQGSSAPESNVQRAPNTTPQME